MITGLFVKLFSFFYWIRWHLIVRPYRKLCAYLNRVVYVELEFENCETMKFRGDLITNLYLTECTFHTSKWDQRSTPHFTYQFNEGEISILIRAREVYPDGDKIKESKFIHNNLMSIKKEIVSVETLKRLNYRDITCISVKQPFRRLKDYAPKWHAYKETPHYNYDLINAGQSCEIKKNEFLTVKKSLKHRKFIEIYGDYIRIYFSADKKYLTRSRKAITQCIKNKNWYL